MHLLEYFQLDDKGQEIKVYDPADVYQTLYKRNNTSWIVSKK